MESLVTLPLNNALKEKFGPKQKKYHRCVTYRTVTGKKSGVRGPFDPLFS